VFESQNAFSAILRLVFESQKTIRYILRVDFESLNACVGRLRSVLRPRDEFIGNVRFCFESQNRSLRICDSISNRKIDPSNVFGPFSEPRAFGAILRCGVESPNRSLSCCDSFSNREIYPSCVFDGRTHLADQFCDSKTNRKF
jgi:hypothetical protein